MIREAAPRCQHARVVEDEGVGISEKYHGDVRAMELVTSYLDQPEHDLHLDSLRLIPEYWEVEPM